MNAGPEVKNVVLVHGGFVDGSGAPTPASGLTDHYPKDPAR
jgi:hypothetical protein